MHVARLALSDFRSYRSAEFTFAPGVTVIEGRNGHGKTNVIEALEFLAYQHSHRVTKDAPLVRSGAPRAVIGAGVRWGDRDQAVELEINPGRANRARVAGAPRRPREALGILRAVLFAPEDLALVKGDPAGRRRYLDDMVVALAPRMAGVLSEYERVVRQRNALLRQSQGARRDGSLRASMEVWDAQLADVGAAVAEARLSALGALTGPMSAAYMAVAPGGGEVGISYAASWIPPEVLTAPVGVDTREQLAAALALRIQERAVAEFERGITLVGPQRDDVLITLGEFPAKGYASHGESWSLALSLRLAAFESLRETFDTGGDPVLLLDDVFAELDVDRRARLGELVAPAEQVIVTAAVEQDVPPELRGRIVRIVRDQDSRVVSDDG